MKKQDFFLIKSFMNLILNKFVLKPKDFQNLVKNFKTEPLNLQHGEKATPNKKTSLENG